jgi:hypothetical protein
MYHDVVIPEQRLVCGLNNVSGDGKNRSSCVQSNAQDVVNPPPQCCSACKGVGWRWSCIEEPPQA